MKNISNVVELWGDFFNAYALGMAFDDWADLEETIGKEEANKAVGKKFAFVSFMHDEEEALNEENLIAVGEQEIIGLRYDHEKDNNVFKSETTMLYIDKTTGSLYAEASI